MSKTGQYAHLGSKQELHLATVAEAGRILAEEAAREPVLTSLPGT